MIGDTLIFITGDGNLTFEENSFYDLGKVTNEILHIYGNFSTFEEKFLMKSQ